MKENGVSRRTAMKLTGAAAATALVAGCADDNGEDDDNGDGEQTFAIDPDEQILLEGETNGFVGVTPESIEGETNPTLELQDGETYEIGWEQGDGGNHNVVIWDENEEAVEDYYTGSDPSDTTSEPEDGGDFVEFTASEDTVYYRCDPHPDMQGDIVLE